MQEDIMKRHITDEMWIALKQDTIRPEEFMQILEHTCDCTWCAERMAEILEQEDGIETEWAAAPPSYLAGEILERAKQLDVRAAVAVKQTSKRLQLFLYSMKVGVAVAFSMLILVLTSTIQQEGLQQAGQLPKESLWEESAPGGRGGHKGQNSEQFPAGQEAQEKDSPGDGQDQSNSAKKEAEPSVLDWMNQAANGLTDRMNEFADLLLNEGK